MSKLFFQLFLILNISLTPYLRKAMITCRLVRQANFIEGSAFARMFNTQLSKFPRKLCRAGWPELPMHVPPICERTRHPGRAESIFSKRCVQNRPVLSLLERSGQEGLLLTKAQFLNTKHCILQLFCSSSHPHMKLW